MLSIAFMLTVPLRFFTSSPLIRSANNAEKVTLIPSARLFSTPFSILRKSSQNTSPGFNRSSLRFQETTAPISNPQSKPHNQKSKINNQQLVYSFLIRFFRIMNITIALQRLTCMQHACIISLASALAGCQGVRLFVSRLPRISA
jgi:hypothetical protein